MPAPTDEVASAFEELADLNEILLSDRFRVLAYRRVAATLRATGRDVSKFDLAQLLELRGIGKATASKIAEFFESGTIKELEELRASIPAVVLEMKGISGVGPKKAMLLHERLGISSIADLKKALEDGKVRDLPGMGAKTEQNLLRNLEGTMGENKRLLLDKALTEARAIESDLVELPQVARVGIAGSLRRMKETIGDIDILVSTDEPDAVTSAISGLRSVRQVAGSGPTKTSVFTDSGTQVDIRVVAKDEFGAALQYFTGSKEHNVRVREIAVKKGFKLSEYGLFKIDGNERVAAETEEEVYSALGISTPPPTLRENLGEVEKGLRNELPKVVELSDIKGDLHSHSTYSDGRVSLEEMAIAAKERGYGYLAITDHGRKLYGVPNLRVEQIEAQRREINQVNERLGDDFRVLHGIELNISADGSLDYPDEVLASFDIVLASVHHGLTADRETITSRVIAAIRHPEVDIFAHPTSRRMRRRGPSQLDLEAVFEEAQRCGVVLEVNASPTRLDLKDDHVRLAIEVGCRIVINTDSHHPSDLDRMELGVGTAQRGWARPSDVVNTLELEDMLKALRG